MAGHAPAHLVETFPSMRQPISVLVYPVRQVGNGWRYLLLLRRANPLLELPAFWQGVTGALEGEETLPAAARRGLREETGYDAARLESLDFVYSFPIRPAWRERYPAGASVNVEHTFFAIISGCDEPRLSPEHDRGQWYDHATALSMLYWPDNIKALRRCAVRIEDGRPSMEADG